MSQLHIVVVALFVLNPVAAIAANKVGSAPVRVQGIAIPRAPVPSRPLLVRGQCGVFFNRPSYRDRCGSTARIDFGSHLRNDCAALSRDTILARGAPTGADHRSEAGSEVALTICFKPDGSGSFLNVGSHLYRIPTSTSAPSSDPRSGHH